MGETCSQRQDSDSGSVGKLPHRQDCPSMSSRGQSRTPMISAPQRSMGARELQVDVESAVNLGARVESCQNPTLVC